MHPCRGGERKGVGSGEQQLLMRLISIMATIRHAREATEGHSCSHAVLDLTLNYLGLIIFKLLIDLYLLSMS